MRVEELPYNTFRTYRTAESCVNVRVVTLFLTRIVRTYLVTRIGIKKKCH